MAFTETQLKTSEMYRIQTHLSNNINND